ncbi:MAG: hypothetical protein U1F30_10335 [Steroidobacteraceae bacterium]
MTPAARDRVQRLRALDACALSDALDRLGLGGVASGVPQQSGSGSIAGLVVTLKVSPGAPPAGPPRHLARRRSIRQRLPRHRRRAVERHRH